MVPGGRARIALRHVPVNKNLASAEKLLRRTGYSVGGECAHVTDSVAGLTYKSV